MRNEKLVAKLLAERDAAWAVYAKAKKQYEDYADEKVHICPNCEDAGVIEFESVDDDGKARLYQQPCKVCAQ